MIPPSTRLRRAILLNDVLLVHRVLKNYPRLLQNPDYTDKSNTSLHLASEAGHTEIVQLLLTLGHDATEISRNTDHNTALMLAAKNAGVETGIVLLEHSHQLTSSSSSSSNSSSGSVVHLRNTRGLDALALAATCPASTALMPALLKYGARVDGVDLDGNTALHHASASGSLKALRILLGAGANPHALNYCDWTPLAYSQTVAAEVYFKNLIQEEVKRQKMVVGRGSEELLRRGGKVGGGGAVRLVQQQQQQQQEDDGYGDEDEDKVIHQAMKRHWSPVERRRPGTPGGGGAPRYEWGSPPFLSHIRTRSGDGRTRAESG